MPEAAISEYFYGDEAEQFIYFRIPRQLITDPRFKHLSTDAKLLYGMLLDRMSLSVKNGWYDEDGRVYIYYTVEEICGDMNCGRDKAMKMLADLDTKKGVGLLRRVRQGQGKPTKLYVKRFTTGAVPSQPAPPEQPPFTPFPGVDFSGVQKSISPTSASRESRRAGVEKTDPNYTNQNQTDFSYRLDIPWMAGVRFDLLPDAVDVDRHGGVVPHGLQSPDFFVQLLPAEHHVRVKHQKLEQLIFPVFQFHLPAVHIDPAGLRVHPQAACPELRLRLPLPAGQALVPGQVSADPGHQHAGREGLFNVVVRP